MKMRSFVSCLALVILTIQDFSVFASTSIENENISMASDMSEVLPSDSIMQIDASIEKVQIDKKSVNIARKAVLDYIASLAPYDTHWKGQHPRLMGSPVPYYTDDDSAPLTYEWKVRCDTTRDCGSVIVAVIGDETRIAEAGTYGIANYERLAQGKEKTKNKLYYYSPFEQYIQSTDGKTQTVDAIDPNVQQLSANERKSQLSNQKAEMVNYRSTNTISFTKIKDTEDVPMTIASTPMAIDVQHMQPTTNCQSAVPCYDQFTQWYNDGGTMKYCHSGCSPTAMAIIFGYYDRIGVFPKLVGNPASIKAPDSGNTDPLLIDMVNSIRGHMKTWCSEHNEGSTTGSNLKFGMKYARENGYPNSPDGIYTYTSPSFLFPKIRTEINAARPLIATFGRLDTPTLSGSSHSVVIYGYNDTSSISKSQVHISYGWGTRREDQYVSVYSILDGTTGMDTYKLLDITTVPVRN